MEEEMDSSTLAGHPNEWTGEGSVWCPRSHDSAAERPSLDLVASEVVHGGKHFALGAPQVSPPSNGVSR